MSALLLPLSPAPCPVCDAPMMYQIFTNDEYRGNTYRVLDTQYRYECGCGTRDDWHVEHSDTVASVRPQPRKELVA